MHFGVSDTSTQISRWNKIVLLAVIQRLAGETSYTPRPDFGEESENRGDSLHR